MSSKYEYTEEMTARMEEVCADGVTETVIVQLMEEFDYPRRSVTAKLRRQGYDVPQKPKDAPTFTKEEGDALVAFLEANEGTYTAEEIATDHFSKFTSKQINGKALSLEMTAFIKPAAKKVAPKTYTDEQEDTIRSMVGDNAFIEDIADALGKSVNSVRGKLLSMELKAPQRDKKDNRKDAYEGIEHHLDETVESLAERYSKTERGVKTVLARRKLACSDYTPKTVNAE
tara:strand:+ start:21286 stop:21972 length:687 start_codon:yes stop_codon:yes gene_type:complete